MNYTEKLWVIQTRTGPPTFIVLLAEIIFPTYQNNKSYTSVMYLQMYTCDNKPWFKHQG